MIPAHLPWCLSVTFSCSYISKFLWQQNTKHSNSILFICSNTFFHVLWSEAPISCHNLVYIWTISSATSLAIGSSSTYHFQSAVVNQMFFQTIATCLTSLSSVSLPQSVKSSKVIWILSTKYKQRISESVLFLYSLLACKTNLSKCHLSTSASICTEIHFFH